MKRETKSIRIFFRAIMMALLLNYLPNGGKPPATDDDGLRMFLASALDADSVSGAIILLPLPLV